jgi:hypothetical protein
VIFSIKTHDFDTQSTQWQQTAFQIPARFYFSQFFIVTSPVAVRKRAHGLRLVPVTVNYPQSRATSEWRKFDSHGAVEDAMPETRTYRQDS